MAAHCPNSRWGAVPRDHEPTVRIPSTAANTEPWLLSTETTCRCATSIYHNCSGQGVEHTVTNTQLWHLVLKHAISLQPAHKLVPPARQLNACVTKTAVNGFATLQSTAMESERAELWVANGVSEEHATKYKRCYWNGR